MNTEEKNTQLPKSSVSDSTYTLHDILGKIREVGLINNNITSFGDGYEKAINDVLLKFQNKCKKCSKNIDQKFIYCSFKCKDRYYY